MTELLAVPGVGGREVGHGGGTAQELGGVEEGAEVEEPGHFVRATDRGRRCMVEVDPREAPRQVHGRLRPAVDVGEVDAHEFRPPAVPPGGADRAT